MIIELLLLVVVAGQAFAIWNLHQSVSSLHRRVSSVRDHMEAQNRINAASHERLLMLERGGPR